MKFFEMGRQFFLQTVMLRLDLTLISVTGVHMDVFLKQNAPPSVSKHHRVASVLTCRRKGSLNARTLSSSR